MANSEVIFRYGFPREKGGSILGVALAHCEGKMKNSEAMKTQSGGSFPVHLRRVAKITLEVKKLPFSISVPLKKHRDPMQKFGKLTNFSQKVKIASI